MYKQAGGGAVRVADFDYYLPEELIAQEPVEPRDASRLLVLHRRSGRLEHRVFRDIIHYLDPRDVLVVNDTRVLPARLFGARQDTGGKVEILLLRRLSPRQWEVLVKPGRRARPGTWLQFGEGLLEAEVKSTTDSGGRIVQFKYNGVFEEILDKLGHVPLPPYIRRELRDEERYQTVYARVEGSAAAPTAGLHFTPELLDAIRKKGTTITAITLHVGLGTFRPVKTEVVEEHRMHAEYYVLEGKAVKAIEAARRAGGRVIAVGTTSTRALEAVAQRYGKLQPASGWTDIFIYPGYQFKVVDGLITNFHLPRSTLLMLVSALAGREQILQAYQEAIREKYRFFSFGDAMFIT